jgi:hypothetical protein
VKRVSAERDQDPVASAVRLEEPRFVRTIDVVVVAGPVAIGVVRLDPQLVGNDSADDEPAIHHGDTRVIAKRLSLYGQHPFVDEPITVVILSVARFLWPVVFRAITIVVPTIANLVTRTHRALTNNAQPIIGAHVFTLDALTNTCPLAAGVAELRPIFINLVVAVVVDPVARLDTRLARLARLASLARLRLPVADLVQLLTRPIHIAQRLGANERAATVNGHQPRDGQDRRRARQERMLRAARMYLQES